MQNYYIFDANQQVAGPYPVAELRQQLERQVLDLNTRVCLEGTEEWKAIGEVPELSAGLDVARASGKPAAPGNKGMPLKTMPELPRLGYTGPVFLTLCLCIIGGIIVLVYTSQANEAAARGDVEAYERLKAKRSGWITASVIISLLFILIRLVAVLQEGY